MADERLIFAHAGKIYRRVAKRQVIAADGSTSLYHWCKDAGPEIITGETPPHICDIWEVAGIEADQPPKKRARPTVPTIRELIERVSYTQEETSVEPVSLLTRAQVLASLYQAQFLNRMVRVLEGLYDAVIRDGYLSDPDADDEEDEDDEDDPDEKTSPD